MKTIKFNYINLILLHAAIGFVIFLVESLSKVYFAAIIVFFLYRIFNATPKKRPIEVLIACSYIIGCEVFLRMTGGTFTYESAKYTVILFLVVGISLSGVSKRIYPYSLYIFLLLPGIALAAVTLNYTSNFRTAVAFNISGPICLGIAAVFCYRRKIEAEGLGQIIHALIYPVIANVVYLFFYTPSIRDILSGTQSNFAASGGYGPNQVATVLGLGMFALVVKFVTNSKDIVTKALTLSLLTLVSYRAIITFSRGGVIVAVVAIVVFLLIYFNSISKKYKRKFLTSFSIIIIAVIGIWFYSSIQTLGFIDKRYTNKDAAGRIKGDFTTGRVELMTTELNEFFNNPFLGLGVGKVKEERLENTGIHAASHNEMSRILAEHGSLGVIALLILIITPLVWRSRNRSNYLFYSFYLFWFFTINHSSMRIAAPALIYALCLLDINYGKPIIHRKQIS